MILFNTTYLVAPQIESRFLLWIRKTYVPELKKCPCISHPKMLKVLSNANDGISYSLQIEAANVTQMNEFKKNYLNQLEQLVTKTFGQNVLFFSTYLKEYELE